MGSRCLTWLFRSCVPDISHRLWCFEASGLARYSETDTEVALCLLLALCTRCGHRGRLPGCSLLRNNWGRRNARLPQADGLGVRRSCCITVGEQQNCSVSANHMVAQRTASRLFSHVYQLEVDVSLATTRRWVGFPAIMPHRGRFQGA